MIMMHAENGIAIDVLVAQSIARGDTDPKFHSLTRPAELESEATHRAIQLAKVAGNVPLYIVHMSASEALGEVAAAQHAGLNVFAETCPQYLYLTLEDQLAQPGFEGAKWVCSTPLRTKHEHHQADLWKGLRMNELAVVSTDHCPFCFKDQKELGLGQLLEDPQRDRRRRAPHGADLPGCRARRDQPRALGRDVLHHAGAHVRPVAHKGVIEPGADADILVWDPNRQTKIGINDKHHMNMDHSAYEGFEIDGKVDTVISRGTVVIENDTYVGTKGHGKFVKRGLSTYLH